MTSVRTVSCKRCSKAPVSLTAASEVTGITVIRSHLLKAKSVWNCGSKQGLKHTKSHLFSLLALCSVCFGWRCCHVAFSDQENHSVSNKSVVSSLFEWTAAESSPALPDDCLLGRAGAELLSAKWDNSGVSGLLRCSQVTNTGRWSQAPARGYCQRYHLS